MYVLEILNIIKVLAGSCLSSLFSSIYGIPVSNSKSIIFGLLTCGLAT